MPRPDFTDLGKTKLRLPSAVWSELRTVTEKITGTWEKLKRREINDAKAPLCGGTHRSGPRTGI
jgi:hypothetical protein